ncbi:hypothetical protein C8R44DRAFT_846785 [Mycena epipterygia]|nr:hypothetical protein C8R44DRAFT_846785 [Mycena epipterygia]
MRDVDVVSMGCAACFTQSCRLQVLLAKRELASNAISWWLKLKGDYLKSLQPGIGVVSDIAVAISNRICTNLAILGFIFGDLGAKIDGVPTEYKRYSTLIRRRSLTPYASLYGPVSVKRGDLVLVKDTSGVSIVVRLGSFCNLRSLRAEKMRVAAGPGTQDGISYIATPDWDEEVIENPRRCIDDHSLCDGVCSSGVNGVGILPSFYRHGREGRKGHHVGSEAATVLGLRWKKIRVHE